MIADPELLLGAIALGVLVVLGGSNLSERGRGGEMTRQGQAAVVVGAIMVIYGLAGLLVLYAGLDLQAAVLAAIVLVIGVYIGRGAAKRSLARKRALAAQQQQASTQARYKSWHEFIQRVTPAEFERFCGWVFEQQGYQVQLTGQTGDGGIDMRLKRDGGLEVAQCKKYSGSIGSGAVRDFYGAMVGAGADAGHFLTTSRFTQDAAKFAKGKALTLWDRSELEPWVARWNGQPVALEKRCKFCQSENRLEARFCSKCGGPL